MKEQMFYRGCYFHVEKRRNEECWGWLSKYFPGSIIIMRGGSLGEGGGERCEFYIFLEWRKSRGKVEEQMFEEPFPSAGAEKEELQLWGWWYEYF